jgi:sigma-B regulation protein RsbU (phosphoserine phosphatase)
MFFLEIDSSAKILRWVRAGHDPAMFYDPSQDCFLDLSGEGVALGVVSDFRFSEFTRQGWDPGSIIVVGTDGIREARNTDGEMFGLDRLEDVVRKYASESAESIQNAVIANLRSFQGDAPQEDDITLVVVKLL